jgi:hypothetical protein
MPGDFDRHFEEVDLSFIAGPVNQRHVHFRPLSPALISIL